MVVELADSLIANTGDLTAAQIAGCHSAVDNVTSGIMRSKASTLKKIDRIIADTYAIPAHVVLPEHQMLAKHEASAADEKQLSEELARLETEFRQQAQFMTSLDAELRLHEQMEENIERELRIMEHVEQSLLQTTTSTVDCKAAVLKAKAALDN